MSDQERIVKEARRLVDRRNQIINTAATIMAGGIFGQQRKVNLDEFSGRARTRNAIILAVLLIDGVDEYLVTGRAPHQHDPDPTRQSVKNYRGDNFKSTVCATCGVPMAMCGDTYSHFEIPPWCTGPIEHSKPEKDDPPTKSVDGYVLAEEDDE